MTQARETRPSIRRLRPPVVLVVFLLATEACGDRTGAADPGSGWGEASSVDTLSSVSSASTPHTTSEFPLVPGAVEAMELSRSMRRAWTEAGEPPDLFDDRFGEVIAWTDASWEDVRAFYRARADRVLMDHEMEFPDVGRQKMLTGLVQLSDGSIVKFTATRPFFRYPDQWRIDRTVIQLGRLVEGGAGVSTLAPSESLPPPTEGHSH